MGPGKMVICLDMFLDDLLSKVGCSACFYNGETRTFLFLMTHEPKRTFVCRNSKYSATEREYEVHRQSMCTLTVLNNEIT